MRLNRSLKMCVLLVAVIGSEMALAKTALSLREIEDRSSGRSDCRTGWDHWWRHLSKGGFREQLTTELSKTGKFEVLEREHLGSLLDDEINLQNSEKSQQKLQRGRFKQAKYVVAGSLTEFEYCAAKEGGSVNVGRLAGLLTGNDFPDLEVGKRSAKAHIGFDIRIIDSETGAIIKSFTVESESSEGNFNLSVGGLFDYESEKNSPMGKSFREAMAKAADQIKEVI